MFACFLRKRGERRAEDEQQIGPRRLFFRLNRERFFENREMKDTGVCSVKCPLCITFQTCVKSGHYFSLFLTLSPSIDSISRLSLPLSLSLSLRLSLRLVSRLSYVPIAFGLYRSLL